MHSARSAGGGPRGLAGYARKVRRGSRGPLLLLVAAVAAASFAGGTLVGRYRLFPYSVISDGLGMLSGNADEFVDDGMFAQFVDDGEVWRPLDAADVEKFSGPPSETAVANRVEFLAGDALHEPVLWYGGRFQFMELCPEWGCLAVQFGTDGEVEHAWPLRPGVLEQAWNAAAADASPPESAHDFSFALDFFQAGCRGTRTATCWWCFDPSSAVRPGAAWPESTARGGRSGSVETTVITGR